MKIRFNITNNKDFACLLVNTPLKKDNEIIGKIIDSRVLDNGMVEVDAEIDKKYQKEIQGLIK